MSVYEQSAVRFRNAFKLPQLMQERFFIFKYSLQLNDLFHQIAMLIHVFLAEYSTHLAIR